MRGVSVHIDDKKTPSQPYNVCLCCVYGINIDVERAIKVKLYFNIWKIYRTNSIGIGVGRILRVWGKEENFLFGYPF